MHSQRVAVSVCAHVCVALSVQTPWAGDLLTGASDWLMAKEDQETGADSRAVPQEQSSEGRPRKKQRHF